MSLLFLLCVPALPLVEAKPIDAFKNLAYRAIGPAIGGRVCRVAGVAGDPLTYYAATAGGGVWKSSDGGHKWEAILDTQADSSFGSIATAPSDPNVVYAGAGEANIRGNVIVGHGFYVSTDAGTTWRHTKKLLGQIGKIVVHPTDSAIAYAAVLGSPFGPGPERGIYRTQDTGATWERILFKNDDTGAIDIEIDPKNPRRLFAALWQTRRKPWEMTSGGPGSDLQFSADGGATWQSLKDADNGLPPGPWGRIGIAIAPSDPKRVYVSIEAAKGGLYRSDDGGNSWVCINSQRYLRLRPWYFSCLTVDPTNPDRLFVCSLQLLHSIDGGRSFRQLKTHHVDHHDVWIDPKNPRRLIVADDGGVDISINGRDFFAPPLPLCQFYHVACDTSTPYKIGGTIQDQGTACAPSNSLNGAGILLSDWHSLGGGEAGHVAFDPLDPNIAYAGEYSGTITRYNHRTRHAVNVSVYPFNASGHGGDSLRYRFQWTAPILASKHQPGMIYHAGNVLFASKDGGQTWTAVSGDLTRNDKSKQRWSGGPITGDNTGVEIYGTIFALAESPADAKLLWVGSDDGLVHLSRDLGKTWLNVTPNIPDLPDWGTVSCIEPHPTEAGTALLIVDAHRLNDFRPYAWRTKDFGKTWQRLTKGLDEETYLHTVRFDPTNPQVVYLGTERGVCVSFDGGNSWHSLQLNLPTVPVHDLVVKGNDLVVGTHGRSIWVLDDLTPIRQWSAKLRSSLLHLFPISPAIRWIEHSSTSAHIEANAGENPPKGVVIYYHLKREPKEPLTLEIRDAAGKVLVTFDSTKDDKKPDEDLPDGVGLRAEKIELPAQVGINRFVWDGITAGPKYIPGVKVDAGDPTVGYRVPPGEYTLTLKADGRSRTGTFVIRPDPRLRSHTPREDKRFEVSPEQQKEQAAFTRLLFDDLEALAKVTNDIRTLKKQLLERVRLLASEPTAQPLLVEAKKLRRRLDELENALHNPKAKVVYDILAFRGGAKLYSQLSSLYEFAKDLDGEPPMGMRELHKEFHKELTMLMERFQAVRKEELAAFNTLAKKLDFPSLWVPR